MNEKRRQCLKCELANLSFCQHYEPETYEAEGWVLIGIPKLTSPIAFIMKRMGEVTVEYLFICEQFRAPVIVTSPKGAYITH